MAGIDQGADLPGDRLVVDHQLEAVVERGQVLDREVDIDAHRLRRAALVPVDADLRRDHQVADEDVAHGARRVGDVARLRVAHGCPG